MCDVAVKYAHGMQKMVEAYEGDAPRREDLKVTLCIGPAGTGKTHCAMRNAEGAEDLNAYVYDPNASGFWNGYSGQSHVVLDEFRGCTLRPLDFQRICDKTPYTCNIKGGHFPFRGTDIRITSNFAPHAWWSAKTKISEDAIWRRIHVVHFHYDFQEKRVYETTPGAAPNDRASWAFTKFYNDPFVTEWYPQVWDRDVNN